MSHLVAGEIRHSSTKVEISQEKGAFYANGVEVIISTTTDETALKALQDAGFYPVNPALLREKVREGHEARNILKSLGLDVPTNPGYKQL